jgi:molybdenum cofactor synthesis domain-containing protein
MSFAAPGPTAAVLMIGDELLSGRTQDANLRAIAQFLAPMGVELMEARVVRDVHERIVVAVRTLAAAHSYLFTTGGIGPTHDDITADAVAVAFGAPIDVRDDARAILVEWYRPRELEVTPARLRMARIPDGASLIANPVSGAPGFQLANVFVLAGVPAVMRGMLQDVAHRIQGGAALVSRTVRATGAREGDVADGLGAIAKAHPEVSVGSYPWWLGPEGGFGVNFVVRGRDAAAVEAVAAEVAALARPLCAGVEIEPAA